MSSKQYVLVEKRDQVAKVILNDPERRNTLSKEMIAALIAAFEELRDDDSISVVITTGAGDISWSAGQRGQNLLEAHERREQYRKSARFDAFRVIELDELVRLFPKVTIAAVNGYCLGAGMTFLISHDLAIASAEKAAFGLPEVMRGFVPRYVVAAISRAVSRKWAFDMILTGDNWDAGTAQKAGLITRIVPHAQLQESAFQWAKELARWDPVTLEYCKRSTHASLDQPTYLQAIEVAGLINWQHSVVNPRSHDGMRDFLAGKGIKANQMIKWV